MKAQAISALTAGLYVGIGLSRVLNPFWWRSKVNNPFEVSGFELSGDAARWYRRDQLSWSLRGRANAYAREQWMRAAAEQAEQLPPGAVTAVDEFDWRARPIEEFFSAYLRPCRPVVFRGLMRDHTDLERWRLERLLEEFGDERVRLTCPVNPDYQGAMAEIDIPGVYMHNSDMLFGRNPQLVRELGVASMAQQIRGPLLFGGLVQLFAGRKRTGSRWHAAPPQNMFMMLEGRKKWSFIEPSYSPLMSPYHTSGDRVFWVSEAAEHTESARNVVDRLVARDRKAVLEARESKQQKRVAAMFSKCPRREVVLEPGDVLSVPPWWWHEVDNLSDKTVAAATRWFDPTAKLSPNGDLEALLMLRPGPAYHSSLPAFAERIMTLQGELVDNPKLEAPVFDVEANTALTPDAYGDIREGVEAYYARQRQQQLRLVENRIAS